MYGVGCFLSVSSYFYIGNLPFLSGCFCLWYSVHFPILCLLLLLLSHFSRVRLCDPIDGSPPGSPIPGILQARTLKKSFSSNVLFQNEIYILFFKMYISHSEFSNISMKTFLFLCKTFVNYDAFINSWDVFYSFLENFSSDESHIPTVISGLASQTCSTNQFLLSVTALDCNKTVRSLTKM